MIIISNNKGIKISGSLGNKGETNSNKEQKLFQSLFRKGVS